jgi:protein-L-isoaspartate(D-aspartate) O-methyltransferase
MVELQLAARGIGEERLLAAMAAVERERFVPADHQDDAYADVAIPIGYGQVLSAPHVVARSLALLDLVGTEHLLVVGVGSGYLAAVAARLAGDVIAVDRVPQLAARATRALAGVGVANVRVLAADGSRGVPAHAPYDAILATYATTSPPLRLAHELREGGRLVARIGDGETAELRIVANR